jgi:hypothetical protein
LAPASGITPAFWDELRRRVAAGIPTVRVHESEAKPWGLRQFSVIDMSGNVAPGQDTAVDVAGSSGPLPTPRNGQFVFTGLRTDPPTVPNFPTCPNPQWIAHVVDVTFGDATHRCSRTACCPIRSLPVL